MIGAGVAATVAPLLALSLLAGPAPAPPAAPAARACVVEGATLTWGFKESFRSYISGAIANGEWTVSDGATYETPSFVFPGGTGDFGEVSFEGAIRFTGHGGILDTTVANPVIRWGGDRGILYLDVSGTTQEGDPVEETGVPFADLVFGGILGDEGDFRFEDVAATLTDEGAAAFGTYESGEALDALALSLDLESACSLPVQQQAGPPVLPWIAGGVGAVVIAGVALLVARRRKERAQPAASPDPGLSSD